MTNGETWHNVGKRVRWLRKTHGLTLKQLARGCDLSTNAISLVERGEVAPTIATLCKIAQALGTSVSALLQEACPSEVVLVRAHEGAEVRPVQKLAGNLFDQIVVRSGGACSLEVMAESPRQYSLCLSGQVEFEDQDGQVYQIQAGDRLLCNGAALQRWRNPGAETAIVILVLPPGCQAEP